MRTDSCRQCSVEHFSLSLLQMVSALHLTSIPLIWLIPILEEIYNTLLYPRPLDQESINPRLAAWPRLRYSYFVFSRARCIVRRIVCTFVAVYIPSSRERKFDSSKQIVLPVGAVGPCGERSHLGITSQHLRRSPSMFSTQGFPGIQIIPCLQ